MSIFELLMLGVQLSNNLLKKERRSWYHWHSKLYYPNVIAMGLMTCNFVWKKVRLNPAICNFQHRFIPRFFS